MAAPDRIDPSTCRWFANHHRSELVVTPPPSTDALDFHRTLPDYRPSALIELPPLADELGVGRVMAKDESSRLGLPAFKALGASWAMHRSLQDRTAGTHVTFVAATDGNHGRAVARFARLAGHAARIFVPLGVHPAAIAAIEGEGAPVMLVDGSYDDAVAAAAASALASGGVLIQDTSWPGYTDVPTWIVEGYGTMFVEIDGQLPTRPDLLVVPVGVGSLAHAALAHYRAEPTSQADSRGGRTAVMSVEPQSAACVLAGLEAGRAVTVATVPTIMAGLNCGTPSSLAWPLIIGGLDAAVAVTDAEAAAAMTDLGSLGVAAGPCGAASLAAARFSLTGSGSEQRRQVLGIDVGSTVVLLITEGRAANPQGQPTVG
ncbi:MAG: PLP-dependent lyase/thiolase [Acidimicrobiales bacterium]|nr:PLP-dependent lyase/thiolase [Acidimicrobiales bacterium]